MASGSSSSTDETAYLLSSSANAQRLLAAIAEDQRGEPDRSLAEVVGTLGLGGAVGDAAEPSL